MVKNKTIRNLFILAIIFVLLIVGYFGFSQQIVGTFEFGFKPYGESSNQITNLNFVKESNGDLIYKSKYWDIIQRDTEEDFFGDLLFPSRDNQVFSGSDLGIISASPQGGGSERPNPKTYTILTSTENFNEKDFKAKFISNPSGESGTTHKFFGSTSVVISLIGDSGKVIVMDYDFARVSNPRDLNVVINPSVVTNRVSVFVNGIKSTEINYEGNYKIQVEMATTCGSVGQTRPSCGTTIIMKDASFKQQFGCTKEPGEQFYRIMFNEGDQVNINKLDEFKKFCLAESPLTIFSNVGSTTNVEILESLVNGEEFRVPQGEIWSIDYIGDITLFKTECEENGIYNLDEGECMARTVVTTSLPSGESTTIETKPAPYILSGLATHQALEKGRQFRFTHILQDEELKTPVGFNIGSSSFISSGISYSGFEVGAVSYPEDKSNWRTSFNFDEKSFEGVERNVFTLNDFIDVEITDMEAYKSESKDIVVSYKAEYTFSINPDFLTTTFEDGKIIVENTYETISGGLTLTTTNNVGTTTVEVIDKTLILGKTIFPVNMKNIVSIKARPFITLDLPGHKYKIDSKTAFSSESLPVSLLNSIRGLGVFLLIIPIIILSLIGLIIYNLRRRKRK